MQDKHAIKFLIERLNDLDEDLMVRHEAVEALGAIDRKAMQVLEKFVDDPEPVISDHVRWRLILEWVESKKLDYDD